MGLGSIAVFAVLQLGLILVALGLKVCKVNCPCKWGRDNFSTSAVWNSSLTFVHGTFFEIIVCVSISMSMIPFFATEDLFSDSDKISCVIALLFAAIMIAYILFISYFICVKQRKLVEHHVAEVEERNIERADSFYHESLIAQREAGGATDY